MQEARTVAARLELTLLDDRVPTAGAKQRRVLIQHGPGRRVLKQSMRRPSDQFVARHAEQGLAGTVDEQEAVINRILHVEHRGDVLDHRVEEAARAAQFRLGELALGDVDARSEHGRPAPQHRGCAAP
ncbi:hypothetical protein ES708_32292 [subsurface metagenome]